jgi:hypothetical protein
VVRASGSYPLCQGFDSLHRHRFFLLLPFAALGILTALGACRDTSAVANSAEEETELARAKADAEELLSARLLAPDSSLSVRLRAIRGLVEMGRLDKLRGALRELPVDQARVLVESSVPNVTWLAMASSVPDGRLRQPQVFAKDALLLLDEWMSPDVRRDARAVVVRWFAVDPTNRAAQGDVPLARADVAIRTAVAGLISLRGAKRWSELPAIASLALSVGTDADRRRLRAEAVDEFLRAPFGTPQERAEARAGVLAALRGLSGDAAALKAGLQGRPLPEPDNAPLADLAELRAALAAIVASAAEPAARRNDAAQKLEELGAPLRPLGLVAVVADEAAPVELRAALAGRLAREGEPAAAAAAALATDPAVFAAAAGKLSWVKMGGGTVPFAQALAAQQERLASLPGRCAAVVDALSAMGPRRSATAATLLLGTADPFIMSLGVAVLARVGTPEHSSALEEWQGSKERSACWPERTLGEAVGSALEEIAKRGTAAGPPVAGDE